MSARKLETPEVYHSRDESVFSGGLMVSAEVVRFHRNGIEFETVDWIEPLTEMSVELQPFQGGGWCHCRGVVVACNGDRQTGYRVVLLLLGLSSDIRQQLGCFG